MRPVQIGPLDYVGAFVRPINTAGQIVVLRHAVVVAVLRLCDGCLAASSDLSKEAEIPWRFSLIGLPARSSDRQSPAPVLPRARDLSPGFLA